jgi:hypothetical protein
LVCKEGLLTAFAKPNTVFVMQLVGSNINVVSFVQPFAPKNRTVYGIGANGLFKVLVRIPVRGIAGADVYVAIPVYVAPATKS